MIPSRGRVAASWILVVGGLPIEKTCNLALCVPCGMNAGFADNRRSHTPERAAALPICSVFAAGATGLEPATSRVRGPQFGCNRRTWAAGSPSVAGRCPAVRPGRQRSMAIGRHCRVLGQRGVRRKSLRKSPLLPWCTGDRNFPAHGHFFPHREIEPQIRNLRARLPPVSATCRTFPSLSVRSAPSGVTIVAQTGYQIVLFAGLLWPREESNLRTQIRSLPLYPLSYGAGSAHGSASSR